MKIFIALIVLSIAGFAQDSIVTHVVNGKNYFRTEKLLPDNKTDANLIISLDTLNLNYSKHIYKAWKSIPIYGNYKFPIVDANGNGKLEYYGRQDMSVWDSASVFEFDNNFNDFDLLYRYQDTLIDLADVTYNLKDDSLYHIIGISYERRIIFFTQASKNSLINKVDFVFTMFSAGSQPTNMTFVDIDQDGKDEIICYIADYPERPWGYTNSILKYNKEINNYKIIYSHQPRTTKYTFGITTGDFDNDGRMNFATSDMFGYVYIYEHLGGENYRLQFQKKLDCYNMFMTGFSNDMDGNGKPEIWVSGNFGSSTYGGITRIFVLETADSNQYEQKFQIDIRGLSTFFYGNIKAADFDKSGRERVMVQNAGLMFFFSSDAINSYKCDYVIYNPIADSSFTANDFLGVYVKDLDNDSVPELITLQNQGGNGDAKSIIMKLNNITSVSDKESIQPQVYILHQNYPNPFNSTTTIKFELPERSKIKLSIYNIIGEEVATLINGEITPGVHETAFNSKELPSGIYIYRLLTGKYSISKKLLLLK